MNTRPEIEASEADYNGAVTLEQEENSNQQAETEAQQIKGRTYRFRMRHFFYVHLIIFITTGLLGGLTIYLVENYSVLKNRQMTVSYVNAWFVSCTCAYSCGLTTLDFAKLSKASQIFLLVLTFFSGITISTLPALVIQAYRHRGVEDMTIDDNSEIEVQASKVNQRHSISRVTYRGSSPELERKLALLPTPQQIRYWADITVILLILAVCAGVYLFYFIILGAWLAVRYPGNELAHGNSTVNPWYASIIIVMTGFNQNGLTPFSDGMTRFVNDAYMNIFVMMVRLPKMQRFFKFSRGHLSVVLVPKESISRSLFFQASDRRGDLGSD
jgi:hypothetical protein